MNCGSSLVSFSCGPDFSFSSPFSPFFPAPPPAGPPLPETLLRRWSIFSEPRSMICCRKMSATGDRPPLMRENRRYTRDKSLSMPLANRALQPLPSFSSSSCKNNNKLSSSLDDKYYSLSDWEVYSKELIFEKDRGVQDANELVVAFILTGHVNVQNSWILLQKSPL